MTARRSVPPARLLSVLLHPIWMPLAYGLAAFPFSGEFLVLNILIVIFLLLVPGGLTLLWLRIRWDTDMFVVERANRIFPLAALLVSTAFFAVACGALLPEELFPGRLMALVLLLAFVSLIVTLYWKISLHMIGWGAAAALVFAGGFFGAWWFLPAVLAGTALAAWARIALRSHGAAQLIAGWLLGFGMHSLLQAFW